MTLRPCITCGEPTAGTYCPDHHVADRHHDTARQRGYDTRWDRLSRKARQLQPFCSDCHTTEDLTTDHSPQAWQRQQAGKRIRLRDVDVVCRSCNARRGRAR